MEIAWLLYEWGGCDGCEKVGWGKYESGEKEKVALIIRVNLSRKDWMKQPQYRKIKLENPRILKLLEQVIEEYRCEACGLTSSKDSMKHFDHLKAGSLISVQCIDGELLFRIKQRILREGRVSQVNLKLLQISKPRLGALNECIKSEQAWLSETSCGDAKLYLAVCYICGHEIRTQTEKRADEALRRHFRLKHGVVVPEKIVDGKIEPISSRTRKRAGAVSAEVERAVEALKNFLRRSAAMPEGAMERSNDRNVSVCPFLCSAMLMCTAEVEKPFNESGLASEYCFSEHDECDAYRTQTAVNSDLLSSRRMVAYELAKYSVGSNTRIYIPRPIVRKCVRGCPIKQECKQVLKRAEEGVL